MDIINVKGFESNDLCIHILHIYRKIPNISPGLIEDRKHFGGLIFGGAYIQGLIFGRTFGFKGEFCMPKILHSVSNQRLTATFMTSNFKIGQN